MTTPPAVRPAPRAANYTQGSGAAVRWLRCVWGGVFNKRLLTGTCIVSELFIYFVGGML